jgi:hypothetical protein
MGTFPDFGLRVMRFLRQGMSSYVSRAEGNTNNSEAGRGSRDRGFADLNYSVMVARGQAIFSMCKAKIVQVYRYSVKIIGRFLCV